MNRGFEVEILMAHRVILSSVLVLGEKLPNLASEVILFFSSPQLILP